MANRNSKTASKTARLRAWVESDPTAAPSKGQVFAFLMPSKGGLSTGGLRASAAAERLAGMGLPFWTREGLSRMNTVIRRDKTRKAAAQAWLTGLLVPKAAPVKAVEEPVEMAPEPVEMAALNVDSGVDVDVEALNERLARLEAENARLRAKGDKPEVIPDGMVFVQGHLRRKR